MVEEKPFEDELAKAIRAHNSAKHRVTQVAPEELMFARKLRHELPLVGSHARIAEKQSITVATR